MASDRMDTKAWRDLNAQLNRIALAGERIADALEKYVENDPLAAVTKALETQDAALQTEFYQRHGYPIPQRSEEGAKVVEEVAKDYGSDLPESERWRLGS